MRISIGSNGSNRFIGFFFLCFITWAFSYIYMHEETLHTRSKHFSLSAVCSITVKILAWTVSGCFLPAGAACAYLFPLPSSQQVFQFLYGCLLYNVACAIGKSIKIVFASIYSVEIQNPYIYMSWADLSRIMYI